MEEISMKLGHHRCSEYAMERRERMEREGEEGDGEREGGGRTDCCALKFFHLFDHTPNSKKTDTFEESHVREPRKENVEWHTSRKVDPKPK
jgi:hypothetical protein